MNAFLTSSLKYSLVGALVAATWLVSAGQGWAQTTSTAPIRLAPPKTLRPSAQAPLKLQAPAQTPEQALPQTTPPPNNTSVETSIEVDTLQTINPDTAGVLSDQEGGLGMDMWSGTSHRMLNTLIAKLPVNIRSPTMRDLMRRLLLSSATLPEGMDGSGDYIARRVGLLSAMGDTLSVSRLLNAIPGRSENSQLMRFEADARFLANDNSRACSLAAGQIGSEASVYWQKAFIFCQALAGEHDMASLGVSLLQETGDQDEAFYTLVEALGGNIGILKNLPDPTPMHLSMARVSKLQLPADVVSSNRPGVLRTIAKSPNASVKIRLEAAERAEIAGALDVDILRQLYTSVSFSEQDMANPLTRAEAESGPLSRALLYRTALIQTVPVAQAEAISKALSLGREGGRYASTVRVFMPVLKSIPPSGELAWFAPEAIRAFLIAGQDDVAAPWFALLRASALNNTESAEALSALLPIARIAGSPEADQWGPTQLANWWNQLEKDDSARDNAALLYTLFEGLGDEVPRDAWDALLDGPQQITMAMPNPALWRSLNDAIKAASKVDEAAQTPVAPAPAAAQGAGVVSAALAAPVLEGQTQTERQATPRTRVGEIIMLSLIALGEGGPGQAEPIVLSKVMAGLGAIGMHKEVRALALEAAVAAGF